METLRCPTCLTLLLDGGEKRCPGCHSKLRSKRSKPIILGETSRITSRPTLLLEREMQARIDEEKRKERREQKKAARTAPPRAEPSPGEAVTAQSAPDVDLSTESEPARSEPVPVATETEAPKAEAPELEAAPAEFAPEADVEPVFAAFVEDEMAIEPEIEPLIEPETAIAIEPADAADVGREAPIEYERAVADDTPADIASTPALVPATPMDEEQWQRLLAQAAGRHRGDAERDATGEAAGHRADEDHGRDLDPDRAEGNSRWLRLVEEARRDARATEHDDAADDDAAIDDAPDIDLEQEHAADGEGTAPGGAADPEGHVAAPRVTEPEPEIADKNAPETSDAGLLTIEATTERIAVPERAPDEEPPAGRRLRRQQRREARNARETRETPETPETPETDPAPRPVLFGGDPVAAEISEATGPAEPAVEHEVATPAPVLEVAPHIVALAEQIRRAAVAQREAELEAERDAALERARIAEAARDAELQRVREAQEQREAELEQARIAEAAREAELQRVREAQEQREAELQRAREAEAAREAELRHAREAEAAREAELQRVRESQAAHEAELQRVREVQARRDAELQRAREAEAAREAELRHAREAEARREAELQRAREAEAAREIELQRARAAEAERVAELERAREAEAAREAELRRVREVEAAREAELQRLHEAEAAREAELQRAREAQAMREAELLAQREAQAQRELELEIEAALQREREAELQRQALLQREREAELQRQAAMQLEREAELRREREEQAQLAREAELQRERDAEERGREAELRRERETEADCERATQAREREAELQQEREGRARREAEHQAELQRQAAMQLEREAELRREAELQRERDAQEREREAELRRERETEAERERATQAREREAELQQERESRARREAEHQAELALRLEDERAAEPGADALRAPAVEIMPVAEFIAPTIELMTDDVEVHRADEPEPEPSVVVVEAVADLGIELLAESPVGPAPDKTATEGDVTASRKARREAKKARRDLPSLQSLLDRDAGRGVQISSWPPAPVVPVTDFVVTPIIDDTSADSAADPVDAIAATIDVEVEPELDLFSDSRRRRRREEKAARRAAAEVASALVEPDPAAPAPELALETIAPETIELEAGEPEAGEPEAGEPDAAVTASDPKSGWYRRLAETARDIDTEAVSDPDAITAATDPEVEAEGVTSPAPKTPKGRRRRRDKERARPVDIAPALVESDRENARVAPASESQPLTTRSNIDPAIEPHAAHTSWARSTETPVESTIDVTDEPVLMPGPFRPAIDLTVEPASHPKVNGASATEILPEGDPAPMFEPERNANAAVSRWRRLVEEVSEAEPAAESTKPEAESTKPEAVTGPIAADESTVRWQRLVQAATYVTEARPEKTPAVPAEVPAPEVVDAEVAAADDTAIEVETAVEIEAEIEPAIESEVEAEAEIEPEPEPEIEPEIEIEPEVLEREPEIEAEIEIEPEIEVEVEVETPAEIEVEAEPEVAVEVLEVEPVVEVLEPEPLDHANTDETDASAETAGSRRRRRKVARAARHIDMEKLIAQVVAEKTEIEDAQAERARMEPAETAVEAPAAIEIPAEAELVSDIIEREPEPAAQVFVVPVPDSTPNAPKHRGRRRDRKARPIDSVPGAPSATPPIRFEPELEHASASAVPVREPDAIMPIMPIIEVTGAHVTASGPTFESPIVEVLTDPVIAPVEPVAAPVDLLAEPISVPDVEVIAPIVETLVADEPLIDEPVAAAPVVETPVVETPVVEETVVEAPAVETSAAEEPVVEAPVEGEPVMNTPVMTPPIAETPATEPASARNGSRFRRLIEERTQDADNAAAEDLGAGTVVVADAEPAPDHDVVVEPAATADPTVIEVLPAAARVEVVQPEVVDARTPAVPMTRKLPERTRALRVTTTRKNGRKRWTVDFLVRSPDAKGDDGA